MILERGAGQTQVRDAQIADAERLAEIWTAAWHEAYAGILAPETLARITRTRRLATWLDRIMSLALRSADGAALLTATDDGDPVGLAEIGVVRALVESRLTSGKQRVRAGEVFTLYVDPGQQRRGVGRALLEEACTRFRALGLNHAVLWVLAENEPARAFYRANGFVASGIRRIERMRGRPMSLRYQRAL